MTDIIPYLASSRNQPMSLCVSSWGMKSDNQSGSSKPIAYLHYYSDYYRSDLSCRFEKRITPRFLFQKFQTRMRALNYVRNQPQCSSYWRTMLSDQRLRSLSLPCSEWIQKGTCTLFAICPFSHFLVVLSRLDRQSLGLCLSTSVWEKRHEIGGRTSKQESKIQV